VASSHPPLHPPRHASPSCRKEAVRGGLFPIRSACLIHPRSPTSGPQCSMQSASPVFWLPYCDGLEPCSCLIRAQARIIQLLQSALGVNVDMQPWHEMRQESQQSAAVEGLVEHKDLLLGAYAPLPEDFPQVTKVLLVSHRHGGFVDQRRGLQQQRAVWQRPTISTYRACHDVGKWSELLDPAGFSHDYLPGHVLADDWRLALFRNIHRSSTTGRSPSTRPASLTLLRYYGTRLENYITESQ
jgi:hypothetical protein